MRIDRRNGLGIGEDSDTPLADGPTPVLAVTRRESAMRWPRSRGREAQRVADRAGNVEVVDRAGGLIAHLDAVSDEAR